MAVRMVIAIPKALVVAATDRTRRPIAQQIAAALCVYKLSWAKL
jgi:hypothetical protein